MMLTETTGYDCLEMALRIRPHDAQEVRFMHPGRDLADIFDEQRRDMNDSFFSLRHKNTLLGIAGCPESSKDVGCPWFLGTEEVASYPIAFHKFALKVLEGWKAKYAHLSNYVWESSPSIDWLKRIGFDIKTDSVYITPTGGSFYRFEMIGGFTNV